MSQGSAASIDEVAAAPSPPETPARPPFVPRPDPLYHGVILVLCALVMVLAVVLSVRGSTEVLVPGIGAPLPELCVFRRLTGYGCPGCGMTRCFISLAHFDLRAAWAYNPAGFFLFPLFAFQVPYRAWQLWRIRRGLPEHSFGKFGTAALGVFAVFMVGQWAIRGVAFWF
ncbi:MAG: DUF2752 domain-containing protein [Pirellulaceae bacterium]|nr:DUF2752 domain-containing protein [Pirellulaceae bacterium]